MGRMFSEVTRGWRGFPTSPRLCYHSLIAGMERRRFESGDQTLAGPCRMFLSRFRRDLPYMAFEVLLPLSTSEASGRGPPAVADQVPTILDSWR